MIKLNRFNKDLSGSTKIRFSSESAKLSLRFSGLKLYPYV